ncbi:DNA polymerase I [Helicobacter valdiviensis]|uniref:DNA polymerase I n=1 Tax=Helicobacter valdiviensis TaxID=1458358 RepID=A0A2W6MXA8_9HELI|nr:DNA polymerase I [Helicobacter valdiviensis]PZT48599.1 DNA polymerase I [Helicobacter valdiviensis]
MKTLTIIDTFGFLFRSYFALPPLKNSAGFPTGLLFGFAKLIAQLHREYPEDYLVFALDSGGENFRKKIDPNYKANRPEAPEDLKLQLGVAIKWVELMGFRNIKIEGYEADDVIASINEKANKMNINVRIISHDKDLYQLIDGDTFLFDPKNKKEIREEECKEKYGILPRQFVDYQSIVGDSADNVPGVKGIGAKGAMNLLLAYDSLEGIYENLNNISPNRTKMLLEASREDAYRSRELVRLKRDLLEDFSLENCEMPKESPLYKIVKELEEYELHQILKSLKLNKKTQVTQKENTLSSFSYSVRLVNQDEELLKLIEKITPQTMVSYDSETTSLDVREAKIVGFSFSFDGNEAYYAPMAHNYLGVEEQISHQCALKFIEAIFSKAKRVIGHNLKYDLEILRTNFGFVLEDYSKIGDSMLLGWLLQSDGLCGLDPLMKKYFNHQMISYEDVVLKNENFSQIQISSAAKYASEDAAACYQLYCKLEKLIDDANLLSLAHTLEFPFIQTLIEMELNGITLDVSYLKGLKIEFRDKLAMLSHEIYTLAERTFNINSPQQLAEVLFEDLKLTTTKKTKSGFSTKEAVLQSLYKEHPIIPKILEYREIFKLFSTYIEPLLQYALSNKEHRVYASFMQTGTSTGRLSSKNPNLQNIPVKTMQGRKIREGFIASEGCVLFSLDYSQIELRLLAHFSQDSAMIKAFMEDEDIHLETAKKIFGDSVAKEKRNIAKSINFGLIYGMGPKKLSETLNITFQEAKTYIQNYFQSFPTVKDFLKNQEDFILENGYSKTLFGRKRSFDFNGVQEYQKAAFLREGINAIFQGSAADIIKKAMKKIVESKLESKLLLQVHDELIFEVQKDKVEKEAKEISAIMEGIAQLRVPLKCSLSVGKHWGELK